MTGITGIGLLLKDNLIHFSHACRGELHYYLYDKEETGYYDIAIPINELGDNVLHDTERAICAVKWVRKAIEAGKFILQHD